MGLSNCGLHLSFQLVPDNQINTLWEACKKGNYNNVQKLLENLLLEGYPGSQVLS